jgi:hypothetical protein
MTLITGNTFPVKDQLRALGGKWDAARRGWSVPDDKADEARKLVASAPVEKKQFSAPRRRGTPTGCRCGSVEEYIKNSDCWQCNHDR